MRQDLTERLFNDFKEFINPRRPLTESLMGFGFECGDGWYKILHDLFTKIKESCRPDGFEVIQVKEKFGGLRVYVSSGTDEIYDLIDKAEKESEKTCETCGEPGKIDTSIYWLSCLCDKCKNGEQK